MRAVTFSRLGGPEVLQVSELPEPQPGPGEVRIRVAAATVNPTDISFRSGRQLTTAQLAEMGVVPPYIPGMELAGVVDAVGEGTPWRTGDRVMAIVNPRRPGGGAQAEQVVVPAASVARVPEKASLEAAATLPMNGVTGAAGAVGGYAVELGVADGLRVIAVARSQDQALVMRLGAKTFVPSGDGAIRAMYDAAPGGVDGLIDAAVLDAAVLPAIRDGGKLATVRGFAGPSERGITIEPVRVASYLQNHEALDRLGRLVAEGRLTLRVGETFPPERAAEAQRKMAAGGTRGRLVIVF
jgi:NADPH:quinone reductase